MKKEKLEEQQSILKRIIMRAKPEYFSWSPEKQEQYRARKSIDDASRLERAALQEIFGIRVQPNEETDQVFNSFRDEDYLQFNHILLFLKGIGEDYFYLNEYFPENESLLDYKTLYDYAYVDHCFQEKARRKEDKSYKEKPFRGDLNSRWARLIIGSNFHYATLYSSADYLHTVIDRYGNDQIDELIPHNYVNGSNHGKREEGGFLFDMKLDANGLEPQLEELRHRFWEYQFERYEFLLDQYDQKDEKRIYMIRQEAEEIEPHMDIVFSDKSALANVKFKQFVSDCLSLLGDNSLLAQAEKHEKTRIEEFLKDAHKDILENFDPKVIKLRNKRKVIVAEGAANEFF